MSDLNTLLEVFKAFILTQIKHALESALESFDARLERLEEEGGRSLANEVDDLERGQIQGEARLDDLEDDMRDLIAEVKRLTSEAPTPEDIRDRILEELEGHEAYSNARLERLEARLDRLEATVQAERDGEPARFTRQLRNTLFSVDGGAPVLGASILDDNDDDDGEAFDALIGAWEGGAGSAPFKGPWGAEVRLWDSNARPLSGGLDVASQALWRSCLLTLEAHFKGVNDALTLQAFEYIKRDLESMMKD
jgi:hypothetical protein